jgi:YD repeat-containing protein
LTTAPEGGTSGYTYSADFNNNVTMVTRTPKPGSPLSPLTTAYNYDPIYNRPTQIVDPLGLVTSMSYDGATGNLTTTTSDVGSSPHFNAQRSFTYNRVGQVLTATDPLGIVTQFGYDSFGNQTSIIRDIGPGRLNQLTTIGYSAVGDAISITDPRANTTTNAYDAARRRTTTTAPNGLITAYSYDPDGACASEPTIRWRHRAAEHRRDLHADRQARHRDRCQQQQHELQLRLLRRLASSNGEAGQSCASRRRLCPVPPRQPRPHPL